MTIDQWVLIIVSVISARVVPELIGGAWKAWTGRARQKRDDTERLEATIEQLKATIEKMWARLRVRGDYVEELRAHISRQEDPPPPDYPSDY